LSFEINVYETSLENVIMLLNVGEL